MTTKRDARFGTGFRVRDESRSSSFELDRIPAVDMGFRFEFFDGHRIIMLHGQSPPPASGWDDYLQQIRTKDVTSLGLLVFTAGGAPGPAQRRELNRVLVGRHFARAIVHCSVLVRGVVAAVSWFAPGVKAFDPRAWPAAAAHAGFRSDELPNVVTVVRRLHGAMVDKIPWLEQTLSSTGTLPDVLGKA